MIPQGVLEKSTFLKFLKSIDMTFLGPSNSWHMIWNGPYGPKWSYGFLHKNFQKRCFFLGHPLKELYSPEDCDRSGGGRSALERPLRLGLGLRGKLNTIRKLIYWLIGRAEGE